MNIILFILGVVLGSIITNLFLNVVSAKATLEIDNFNPDKDLYRFNVNNINDLNTRKYLRLKIVHNADLSR